MRKHIPENKMILKKNKVEINSKDVDFRRSDISAYIVQQENSNFLGFMPRTWVYYKTDGKPDKKIANWINEKIGIAPVYFNDESKEKSIMQISKYLNDIGYFNSGISTKIKNKRGRAKVIYGIYPAQPYVIDEITFSISDTAIRRYVKDIEDDLPVQKGDIYNAFDLDDERDMISEYLKNNGYYYFTKDYIFMEIDTNLMVRKANVNIRIDNVLDPTTQKTENHKRYIINNIYIYPKGISNEGDMDTVPYTFDLGKRLGKETFYFVYDGNPKIRFKTFDNMILINSGNPYSLSSVTQTYKALNNLKIYNKNNIEFRTVESNDSINLLNCDIVLNRAKLNDYTIQIEGTTDSGTDLGVVGSFSYRNKNLFRGSEIFNLNIRGGIQAQSILDNDGNKNIFNTKEFGIDASIFLPQFLSPIKFSNFAKEYQPRTTFTLGYNIQIRPIYTRQKTIVNFGYNWMKNKYEQHILNPLTFNSVKVDPSPEFEEILEQETNQRIKDQYTSHLIFGLDYTYIFNNQNIRFLQDFFYFKANFQSSGNLLSAFNNTSLIKTVDNHHEIFGITYAQYLRFSFDFRYFKYIVKEHQIATRFMLGLGIPYGNSYDMPFDKSFYAGGSNGMRGWHFRELGPGAYSNTDHLNIESIGDIQLELNLEYRFPMYSFLKGAIFTDIGNIWTMKESETFVGGEFKFNTFYKQLAMDAGVGLRFDFSVILLRVDAAAPIVNPAFPEGERWRISKLQLNDFILNLGIGYPF